MGELHLMGLHRVRHNLLLSSPVLKSGNSYLVMCGERAGCGAHLLSEGGPKQATARTGHGRQWQQPQRAPKQSGTTPMSDEDAPEKREGGERCACCLKPGSDRTECQTAQSTVRMPPFGREIGEMLFIR